MIVHLHTPTGRTYCGAPPPADRVNGWTAYRSDATCPSCLSGLTTTLTFACTNQFCAKQHCRCGRDALHGRSTCGLCPAPVPAHLRPRDCTCDGHHTASIGDTVTRSDLRCLITMEQTDGCPAEVRALERILHSPR